MPWALADRQQPLAHGLLSCGGEFRQMTWNAGRSPVMCLNVDPGAGVYLRSLSIGMQERDSAWFEWAAVCLR